MVGNEELMRSPAVRVLLIDHVVARRDVMQALITSPAVGATVVGGAIDSASGVGAVEESAPDVVIVEIQLPVDSGLSLLGALRQHVPQVPVIVCSYPRTTE